ncbi:MAG: 30S ribosomal protein S11 [Candidatus Paceibacterota bacterium]|jgi:small subunit ribosomal protein S11
MGKKRIIKKSGSEGEGQKRSSARATKRKIDHGVLHINASYNNTTINLADREGKVVAWSSSGSLGFKGSKKGTPFAAGKVGELLADKALTMGMKEVDIVIKGIGSGRESAIRSFIAKGFVINRIQDKTPVPFNGPKAPKPRRV